MNTPALSTEAALHALARAEQEARLKLSTHQRRRLLWIIQQKGIPAIWSSEPRLAIQSDCLFVTNIPSGLEIEYLLQSVSADGIVIIPYSEDPLFDSLKGNLFEYGTVGAAGADGPHQLWWGGRRGGSIEQESARALPLIASCYATDLVSVNNARQLTLSVNALGLDHAISQCDTMGFWDIGAASKIRYIRNTWVKAERPILWVEPDAVLRGYPALPGAIDCDFAVHKHQNHAFDSSVLYFGRTSLAEVLLQTWYDMALTCFGVSDSMLLDRAWAVVSSQCDLDTAWLPQSYCSHNNACTPGEQSLLVRHSRRSVSRNIIGQEIPLVEDDELSIGIAARRYERTGAPEAQLIMQAETGEHGPVAVLVRDRHSFRPTPSSVVIETIAAAFAEDPGGFPYLEIILCRSDAEFADAVEAAQDYWIVVTTSAERFERAAFRTFGDAIRRSEVGEPFSGFGENFDQPFLRPLQAPARDFLNVKQSETFLMRAADLLATSADRAFA